jgi:hypothetical protein
MIAGRSMCSTAILASALAFAPGRAHAQQRITAIPPIAPFMPKAEGLTLTSFLGVELGGDYENTIASFGVALGYGMRVSLEGELFATPFGALGGGALDTKVWALGGSLPVPLYAGALHAVPDRWNRHDGRRRGGEGIEHKASVAFATNWGGGLKTALSIASACAQTSGTAVPTSSRRISGGCPQASLFGTSAGEPRNGRPLQTLTPIETASTSSSANARKTPNATWIRVAAPRATSVEPSAPAINAAITTQSVSAGPHERSGRGEYSGGGGRSRINGKPAGRHECPSSPLWERPQPFPHVDRNPNTDRPVPYEGRLVAARQTVFHDAVRPVTGHAAVVRGLEPQTQACARLEAAGIECHGIAVG